MCVLGNLASGAAALALFCATQPSAGLASTVSEFTAVWDGEDDGPQWTRWLDEELRDHDEKLIDFIPADAAEFCPKWASLDRRGREQVWITLISAIAKYESSFDADASFDEPPPLSERSIGLLQLSLSDSRDFHCGFTTEAEIEDPRNNLDCGVRILAQLVLGDQVIGGGRSDDRLGAAAYWSVLNHHGHPRSRAFILAYTHAVPGC
jgi:hypothetical protein